MCMALKVIMRKLQTGSFLKPDEETEVKQAKMFRRDSEDKFVILILKLEIQRREGYLQVDPERRLSCRS